jgi:hypothetical protein
MLGMERHFRKFRISESNIVLSVENAFVESLVRGRLYDLERRGHSEPFSAFHKDADALYELPTNHQYAAFNDLHAAYFERLGFLAPFETTLREFPAFQSCIGVIYVAQVVAASDESVDLTRPRDANAKRDIGVRVRAERMLDAPRLETYLRHEWTHLNDLLDPGFRASERAAWNVRSATEEHLLRERYRALWCATIDGRIERLGKVAAAAKAARRADFDRLYRRIPDELRTLAFDRLWDGARLPHPDLMALAESFETVRRFAETGVVAPTPADATERVSEPADGAPCPLCRFPTFRWVLPTDADALIAERIREDFSSWRPEEGVCERCFERYEMIASVGTNPV